MEILSVSCRSVLAEGQQAKGEVQGFVLEIPDETGKTQAVLEGTRAVFDQEGIIQISEVQAKILGKDKERGSYIVSSPQVQYHRNSKVVTTDQPVRIDSKDTHITGRGLVWEPEKQQIFLHEKVRVLLRNLPKEQPSQL